MNMRGFSGGAAFCRKLLLAVTAWSLLHAVSLRAQIEAGTFTLSPYAGGQMSIFVGEEHWDGDYKWGIRAGYNFTEQIAAEFVFGENKTVHDPQVAFCTLYQYGVDMLYHFRPDKRFVPFVAVGGGVWTVDYVDVFNDRVTGYFNFGGGVEYGLTKWLALRADVRHTVVFDHGENLFEGTIGLRFQIGPFK